MTSQRRRRATGRLTPGSRVGGGGPPRAAVQTSPPPGTYDPAIDAQVGQSERGLGDLLSDYVRDYGEPGTALGGRAGEDYGLGRADIARGSARGLEDIARGSDRSLADLLRDRTRGSEDYSTQIQGLDRNYARQGAAQTQTARSAGVQRGGALTQALLKRQQNKAIDRQPLDTGFARFNADSTQAEGRVNEDRSRATSRLTEDTGLAYGDLDRGYLRGGEDAATGLARAQREGTQFGLDANSQRFYQANIPLAGNLPPAAPGAPARAAARTGGTPTTRRRRRAIGTLTPGGFYGRP